MDNPFEVEKEEAIQAGKVALQSLEKAKDYLDSAENWGIVDILGGGFLTSAVKHSKMSDARTELAVARERLVKFAEELKDLNLTDEGLRFSNVFSLIDVFCDDVFADFVVQHRILESSAQVRKAISKVEKIIAELEMLDGAKF